MAEGIVGLPGGGKSYDVVSRVIIPDLKMGKTVFTNIPLHPGNIQKIFGIELSQIKNLHIIPDIHNEQGNLIQPICDLYQPTESKRINKALGATIVHDEIQTSFPFDERRSNADLKRFREWLSHHRHYKTEFYWISQSPELIEINIRRLTDIMYHCRSLKHSPKSYLSKYGLYRRRMFMLSNGEFDHKEPLDDQVIKLDPRVFAAYQSFADVGGKWGTFRAPMPIKIRRALWIAGILSFTIIPWSIYKSYTFVSSTSSKKNVNQVTPSAISHPIHKVEPTLKSVSLNEVIEYDGVFFDSRFGTFVLLRKGEPVARCGNLSGDFFESFVDCGEFKAKRVAFGGMSNGLPTMETDKPSLSGVASR